MATYTDPATMITTADTYVSEQLMTALKDNPTAITEGATGAPKIVFGALSVSWTNQSLAISSSVLLGPGIYIIPQKDTDGGTLRQFVEYKINGTLTASTVLGDPDIITPVICDITGNVRLVNQSTTTILYYQKVM